MSSTKCLRTEVPDFPAPLLLVLGLLPEVEGFPVFPRLTVVVKVDDLPSSRLPGWTVGWTCESYAEVQASCPRNLPHIYRLDLPCRFALRGHFFGLEIQLNEKLTIFWDGR